MKSLKLCGDNTCQALDTHTSLGDLEQFSVSQENNKKKGSSLCVCSLSDPLWLTECENPITNSECESSECLLLMFIQ